VKFEPSQASIAGTEIAFEHHLTLSTLHLGRVAGGGEEHP
jgi:hypothetical protein